MINFISGKVLLKEDNYVLVERGGIGFKVFLDERTLEKIKKGEKINLFCYFCIRNEHPELYGFLEREKLKVFKMLEKIPGVGPQIAIKIASKGSLDELLKAIKEKNFSYFQEIKGLGKKKIQKIILEISGDLEKTQIKIQKEDKTLKGLISLGFSQREAKEALLQVPSDIKEPEERIKKALKILGRG
ncbi:MAG: Holliday junction branch migration protein RuvA [Candidatus Pacebacteria bacterium]|nr:Holliday junction branch migration protein RuvA [Candidatus Paceibacterota bacterium]